MSGRISLRRAGIVAAIGTALAATCHLAAAAHAATYEVSACRLPSGAPAPAYGWATYGPGPSRINCPGGAMTSQPPAGQHTVGSMFGFVFTAPPGTTIANYERHADGDTTQVPGAPPPWNWGYSEFGTSVGSDEILANGSCDNCGVFTAEWTQLSFVPRLTRLFSALQCRSHGGSACTANGAHFVLHSITLRLEDLAAPQVLDASGSVLEKAPQRGQRFLSLKLRDVGGGLLKTRVEVDGQRFSEQGVDQNAGRCRTPFVAPVPCKLSADVELAVDTTRLADGDHSLSLRVFDATGINSALYGPIPITVDNVPDPPGRVKLVCPTNAVGKLSRRLGAKTTRYGGMASVTGRIGGRVSVRGTRVALVDRFGSPAVARSARVGQGRRFRLRLRVRKPLLVRPVLLAPSGALKLCGAGLRLNVRAGVRLSVAPKRLLNGERITMSGRLLGLPVPPAGKTIVIQARAKGVPTWTNVSTIRSGSSGRFTFRYRFRRTFQRTVYEFRAVAPKQRNYPFARGWSRVRRAAVSP
jgi:hypothetical protein